MPGPSDTVPGRSATLSGQGATIFAQNSQARINLRLRSSPGFAVLVVLSWTPLLLLGWTAAAGHTLAPVLPGLILAAGCVAAWRCALRPDKTLLHLSIRDNRLISEALPGTGQEWLPCRGSRLFSRLVWLELAQAEATRHRRRLIINDLPGIANMPAEDFRQLRVWLRLGASYH